MTLGRAAGYPCTFILSIKESASYMLRLGTLKVRWEWRNCGLLLVGRK